MVRERLGTYSSSNNKTSIFMCFRFKTICFHRYPGCLVWFCPWAAHRFRPHAMRLVLNHRVRNGANKTWFNWLQICRQKYGQCCRLKKLKSSFDGKLFSKHSFLEQLRAPHNLEEIQRIIIREMDTKNMTKCWESQKLLKKVQPRKWQHLFKTSWSYFVLFLFQLHVLERISYCII